jgi:cytochrome c553
MNRLTDLKAIRRWLFACCLTLAATAAPASDDGEGMVALLGTCVACHGADGIGKAPQYPNLAGQKAAYLEKQLKAFRSGERKDSDMNALAAPLSDEDIVKLAAYFENLDSA